MKDANLARAAHRRRTPVDRERGHIGKHASLTCVRHASEVLGVQRLHRLQGSVRRGKDVVSGRAFGSLRIAGAVSHAERAWRRRSRHTRRPMPPVVLGWTGTRLWSGGDVNYPDQVVSFAGAALVAHAVTTGQRGVHLDLSQRETVAWTLADQLGEYAWTTGCRVPPETAAPAAPPRHLSGRRRRWLAGDRLHHGRASRRACRIDHRAADRRDRAVVWDNQDAIDDRISAWTVSQPRDEAVATLRRAGVPAVPVRTAADRARDPP